MTMLPTETEELVVQKEEKHQQQQQQQQQQHPPHSCDKRSHHHANHNKDCRSPVANGSRCNNTTVGEASSLPEPKWLIAHRASSLLDNNNNNNNNVWGEPLMVPEWQTTTTTATTTANDDDEKEDDDLGSYRFQNGWQGRDLIHDVNSPVRITEYYVSYGTGEGLPYGMMFPEGQQERRGGVGTRLTGIVVFTNRAESHKGYCHGGSMCSVLDDVIGWCSFLVTGHCRPWSGFTVQINTQLRKPIPVQSTLLVRATITKLERRKVFLDAQLVQPSSTDNANDDNGKEGGDEIIHATAEGLVVLNRGVLPELATRGSLHSWPSSIEIT